MQAPTNPRARGFTLIELMVVTAVVAVLMVILLPGIEQARLDAQQQQCINNLKQIALAMHNYHKVFRVFPPGWVGYHANAESEPSFGWQTMILPFVDQAALYNTLNFDNPLPAANATLQREIPPYRCPTDPTEKTNSMRSKYGTSNYSGNHGSAGLPRWLPGPLNRFWPGGVDTPKTANGILFWNSNIRIRSITDGTSNTFLAGERCVTSAAGIWPGVNSNRNENDQVTDCSFGNEINSGLAAFSSRHRGGAHFVLCDGSARFISEEIDSNGGEDAEMGTFQKLGSRNDGQIIPPF